MNSVAPSSCARVFNAAVNWGSSAREQRPPRNDSVAGRARSDGRSSGSGSPPRPRLFAAGAVKWERGAGGRAPRETGGVGGGAGREGGPGGGVPPASFVF